MGVCVCVCECVYKSLPISANLNYLQALWLEYCTSEEHESWSYLDLQTKETKIKGTKVISLISVLLEDSFYSEYFSDSCLGQNNTLLYSLGLGLVNIFLGPGLVFWQAQFQLVVPVESNLNWDLHYNHFETTHPPTQPTPGKYIWSTYRLTKKLKFCKEALINQTRSTY